MAHIKLVNLPATPKLPLERDEIGCSKHWSAAEGCKLHLCAATIAVGIVEELPGGLVVDDPVVSLLGLACRSRTRLQAETPGRAPVKTEIQRDLVAGPRRNR